MWQFSVFCVVATLVAQSRSQFDPHCSGKQVIVHLFEWKWTDIAKECERFLGPKGFCGVQVSPANEHVMVTKEYMRPWWERYQPVSYKLTSRGGNEAQFTDMVQRCNKAGVRVFVDIVINHMAGLGRAGTGTAGSPFNSDQRSFPGVPFSLPDFNARSRCPSGSGNIDNYSDKNNVRNCNLVGLTDLDQGHQHVRQEISKFLNHLLDIGVAGFRMDAAKHMWPGDIRAIMDMTHDVSRKYMSEGGRPFLYQEVIDQNDGAIKSQEYQNLGYVTEFRYCKKLAWGAGDFGKFSNVVDYGWGMERSDRAFVFVDNHDNQRGHGGGGDVVTFKEPLKYKVAVAFMLGYDYGFTRVMSSYQFNDASQGPPHNSDYSARDVTINADGSCGNGWVCEHRWSAIVNMVAFRNAVVGTSHSNWHDSNDQLAFSRGNKGFVAISKSGHMNAHLQTGLPAGSYCDLITECQTKVSVDNGGMAQISINNPDKPVLAIIVGNQHTGGDHHGSHVTSPPSQGSTVTPPNNVVTQGWKKTVVFVHKITHPGEDLFIRGGLDEHRQKGCSNDISTSKCAIPIKELPIGSGSAFSNYNSWAVGDTRLDWYGPESGQGSSHGKKAEGTPAAWTTNNHGNPSHVTLNIWGDHYWMVEFDMDCSRADGGWFEFKAIVNNNWEPNIGHVTQCTGSVGGVPPVNSNNHWARCGYMNKVSWGSASCEVDTLN